MKRIFTILSVLVVASVVFAETDYKAMKEIARIKNGKAPLENPKASGTLSVDTISEYTSGSGVTIDSVVLKDGEAVIDSKLAAVGPDATTGLMVDYQDITATAATLQTNSFTVAFATAPAVTATYTEDPGDVRPIFISSVTTSNVVFSITADKDYNFIAVGRRP